MTSLYIDTCSNVHTVVSHRTGPLYIHIVSLYRTVLKTNRVQVVSKQEALFFTGSCGAGLE